MYRIIFAITFFLLSGCACGNHHVAPPISLVDRHEKAVLQLSARPASYNSPGHAYLKLAVFDDVNQRSSYLTYGFYPAKDSKTIEIFSTWGELRPELEINNPPSIEVTTSLNSEQLAKVLLSIQQWEVDTQFGFRKYSLTGQNCVSFVNSVAVEAGLLTPPPELEFPALYVAALAKLNAPKGGGGHVGTK